MRILTIILTLIFLTGCSEKSNILQPDTQENVVKHCHHIKYSVETDCNSTSIYYTDEHGEGQSIGYYTSAEYYTWTYECDLDDSVHFLQFAVHSKVDTTMHYKTLPATISIKFIKDNKSVFSDTSMTFTNCADSLCISWGVSFN